MENIYVELLNLMKIHVLEQQNISKYHMIV